MTVHNCLNWQQNRLEIYIRRRHYRPNRRPLLIVRRKKNTTQKWAGTVPRRRVVRSLLHGQLPLSSFLLFQLLPLQLLFELSPVRLRCGRSRWARRRTASHSHLAAVRVGRRWRMMRFCYCRRPDKLFGYDGQTFAGCSGSRTRLNGRQRTRRRSLKWRGVGTDVGRLKRCSSAGRIRRRTEIGGRVIVVADSRRLLLPVLYAGHGNAIRLLLEQLVQEQTAADGTQIHKGVLLAVAAGFFLFHSHLQVSFIHRCTPTLRCGQLR